MDWSQWLYLAALAAAIAGGWGQHRAIMVMVLNCAVTMTSAGNVLTVATADVLCAVLLIGHGWRANVIAGLFAAMVPVYLLAVVFQWQAATTYAIIDVLAYLQCGVLGRVDRGGLRLYRRGRHAVSALRASYRRGAGVGGAVAARVDAGKDR